MIFLWLVLLLLSAIAMLMLMKSLPAQEIRKRQFRTSRRKWFFIRVLYLLIGSIVCGFCLAHVQYEMNPEYAFYKECLFSIFSIMLLLSLYYLFTLSKRIVVQRTGFTLLLLAICWMPLTITNLPELLFVTWNIRITLAVEFLSSAIILGLYYFFFLKKDLTEN